MSLTVREFGSCKIYFPSKGFGFIAADSGSDVFVHATDLARSGLTELYTGQRVAFERQNSPRGPRAAVIELR
jgi:CspA family cold shock protein